MTTSQVASNRRTPKKKINESSRSGYQSTWAKKRRRKGICLCGKEQVHINLKTGQKYSLGKKCLKRERDRKRSKLGCNPRKKDGRGRPAAF